MLRVFEPTCLCLYDGLIKICKCWCELAPIKTSDEAPIVALVGTDKPPW